MRIIPKIEIKNNFVIKGINFEGLRKIGNPKEIIEKYYNQGCDEIIITDIVASLYGRNNLFDLVSEITKSVFIPITLVGGLRTLGDVKKAFRSGADKVGLNSSIIKNPNFLKEVTKRYGEYFPACEDTVDLMQPLVSCTRLRLSQRVKASGFGVPFPPACAGPCAPIPSAHYVLNGTLNAAHILPREHTTHTSRLNADSHEHVKAWPGGRDLKRQRS